jgi:hypothetical protein
VAGKVQSWLTGVEAITGTVMTVCSRGPRAAAAGALSAAAGGADLTMRLTLPAPAPWILVAVLVVIVILVVVVLPGGYRPVVTMAAILSAAGCSAKLARRLAGAPPAVPAPLS